MAKHRDKSALAYESSVFRSVADQIEKANEKTTPPRGVEPEQGQHLNQKRSQAEDLRAHPMFDKFKKGSAQNG